MKRWIVVGFVLVTMVAVIGWAVAGENTRSTGESVGHANDGCTPYSEDRPDLLVCGGDVSANFQPLPIPYFDESICASAFDWLASRSEASVVDRSACLVQESNVGPWLVLFERLAGEGRQVVPYDPTGQDDLVAGPP